MPNKITLACVLMVGLFCILMFASQAEAETNLTISPSRLSPVIPVGDKTTEMVTVANLSPSGMTLQASVENGGGSGNQCYRISVTPGKLALPPGRKATVAVNIGVDAGCAAGEKKAMVLFDAAPAKGHDVFITGSVAVPVEIKIVEPVTDARWSVPLLINSTEPAIFAVTGHNSQPLDAVLSEKVHLAGLLNALDLRSGLITVKNGGIARLRVVWAETPIIAIKKVTISVDSKVGAPVQKTAYLVIFPWKLSLMLVMVVISAYLGARLEPLFANVLQGNWRKGNQRRQAG